MSNIYFDHSATTPLDPLVFAAMKPYFTKNFGNASSLHSFGQTAAAAVDLARVSLAQNLNCAPGEIIFTSGATESDNLAVRGLIKKLQASGLPTGQAGLARPHIITLGIEHEAIIEPCRELVQENCEVDYINVEKNGVMDVQKIMSKIKDNTALISVMYVNSEVGSIQPIREIGKAIAAINDKKLRDWEKHGANDRAPKPRPIYFHTDATQAANFLNLDTKYLHVDLLSLSGHKIYGPKGVGLLFAKVGTPLQALQLGGHHEKNRRSGTLNVPGIVGLAKALQLATDQREENNVRIKIVRDYLIERVMQEIPQTNLTTDVAVATPAHAHFTFFGVEGEATLVALDLRGIAVSTGSACASGSLEASHVLLAMGMPAETAHFAVRFSLGKNNTTAEVDKLMKVLPGIIKKFRKMAPDLTKYFS